MAIFLTSISPPPKRIITCIYIAATTRSRFSEEEAVNACISVAKASRLSWIELNRHDALL